MKIKHFTGTDIGLFCQRDQLERNCEMLLIKTDNEVNKILYISYFFARSNRARKGQP